MKLQEGEYICNACDGIGVVRKEDNTTCLCPHCEGKGKYDWIERITGRIDKQRPFTRQAQQWLIHDIMHFIREEDDREADEMAERVR